MVTLLQSVHETKATSTKSSGHQDDTATSSNATDRHKTDPFRSLRQKGSLYVRTYSVSVFAVRGYAGGKPKQLCDFPNHSMASANEKICDYHDVLLRRSGVTSATCQDSSMQDVYNHCQDASNLGMQGDM